jgi:hypothetical protein
MRLASGDHDLVDIEQWVRCHSANMPVHTRKATVRLGAEHIERR